MIKNSTNKIYFQLFFFKKNTVFTIPFENGRSMHGSMHGWEIEVVN